MKSYTGLRRYLGTRGAICYLKDYHEARINEDGTWHDAIYKLDSYGHDESDVLNHARFMEKCGTDLFKYKNRV